jgi:hypothetical protein
MHKLDDDFLHLLHYHPRDVQRLEEQNVKAPLEAAGFTRLPAANRRKPF